MNNPLFQLAISAHNDLFLQGNNMFLENDAPGNGDPFIH
jgi:hypothetical protein